MGKGEGRAGWPVPQQRDSSPGQGDSAQGRGVSRQDEGWDSVSKCMPEGGEEPKYRKQL